MTIATITHATDLTQGGCNACGPVMSDRYTLTLNGKEHMLTGLSVSGLIMAVVQQAGWKQEFKAEIIDEYFVFSQGPTEVKLVEEFNHLVYSRAGVTIDSLDEYPETATLFKQVNAILTEIFNLAELEFQMTS